MAKPMSTKYAFTRAISGSYTSLGLYMAHRKPMCLFVLFTRVLWSIP